MSMSNEDYVKNGGLVCPFCMSDKIVAVPGSEKFHQTEAWQCVHCENCGRDWDEVYKLSGYEE